MSRWQLGGNSIEAEEQSVTTIKIARRTIAALPAVIKPTVFYDADLKGFGLTVRPSGSRSWIVEFRPGSGGRGVSKRRMVLGSPDELTPEAARAQARQILAVARLGGDPAADRTGERRGLTLNVLAARYMAEAGVNRKLRTQELYWMYWRVHVLPVLGSRKLLDVKHSDIARLRSAIGEKQPTTANRVVSLLRHFFKWAIRSGELPKAIGNPADEIDRYRETRRERFLSPDELARFGAALREAETVGIVWEPDPGKLVKHAPAEKNRRVIVSATVAAAVRLLLFTGCRLREILHLRWEDVNISRGVLSLPNSKSGAKTVILNGAAIDVLVGIPRTGPFVFPGENQDRPRWDLKRPWRLICDRSGLPGVRFMICAIRTHPPPSLGALPLRWLEHFWVMLIHVQRRDIVISDLTHCGDIRRDCKCNSESDG